MYLTSYVELSSPIRVRSLAPSGLLMMFNSETLLLVVLQFPSGFCRSRPRLKLISYPVRDEKNGATEKQGDQSDKTCTNVDVAFSTELATTA
jgi:hypothetical protein